MTYCTENIPSPACLIVFEKSKTESVSDLLLQELFIEFHTIEDTCLAKLTFFTTFCYKFICVTNYKNDILHLSLIKLLQNQQGCNFFMPHTVYTLHIYVIWSLWTHCRRWSEASLQKNSTPVTVDQELCIFDRFKTTVSVTCCMQHSKTLDTCTWWVHRRLRSFESVTCTIRCTRNTYGDRCFAVAGPRVWNSLATELRQYDSLGQFKQ